MPAGSALVITFPEIDRVVTPYRRRLDPEARHHMPAHVTLHVPWLPVESVDQAALAAVRELAESVEPFNVLFERMCWFGESVLFLVPTPAQPLRELAERSARQWPEFPLYGGEFDTVVPHLTVGEGVDARAKLLSAAQDMALHLPLRERADAITWMTRGPDGNWTTRAQFPLGAQPV
jgi:2'-5' RNA ligase